MFSWKFSAWTVQKQLSTAILFRTFFQKIPVVESFFWSNYSLAVQSSDCMTPPRMFSWKSSGWTAQKQLSTAIHFRKFLLKIPVVESLFWSNYRLAVQSSNYILKYTENVFLEIFRKLLARLNSMDCKYLRSIYS